MQNTPDLLVPRAPRRPYETGAACPSFAFFAKGGNKLDSTPEVHAALGAPPSVFCAPFQKHPKGSSLSVMGTSV